ncbi:DUF1707 and DUF4190 domain-containing protein [Nocardia sp. CDC160]|uniref:DUF1707 and DUF4190 domain-containing protein n=1 Tax=Nocardia sp. CDC160 TaxID=3112166 RepID=UPI002DBBF9E6|nr:DUF1707 and DUF4190 domain-containing protein [Nocardia sp. CDC160]MEC3914105.1 DUF1707 and DUF4190 domain-containing protein [Nocardia sp. CDC160]
MEPHWAAAYYLASDADRERAIEALKQNFQAGRLTVEELSDRIGTALNARTFAQLDVVMAGLPWQRASLPVYPNMPPYSAAPLYYAPAAPRSKGMGITSFVLAVLGFFCGLTAVPAVILALVALTDGERREDRGFAIAGLAV